MRRHANADALSLHPHADALSLGHKLKANANADALSLHPHARAHKVKRACLIKSVSHTDKAHVLSSQ